MFSFSRNLDTPIFTQFFFKHNPEAPLSSNCKVTNYSYDTNQSSPKSVSVLNGIAQDGILVGLLRKISSEVELHFLETSVNYITRRPHLTVNTLRYHRPKTS